MPFQVLFSTSLEERILPQSWKDGNMSHQSLRRARNISQKLSTFQLDVDTVQSDGEAGEKRDYGAFDHWTWRKCGCDLPRLRQGFRHSHKRLLAKLSGYGIGGKCMSSPLSTHALFMLLAPFSPMETMSPLYTSPWHKGHVMFGLSSLIFKSLLSVFKM